MVDDGKKQPRRRGRIISAQLPHLLIQQLDALAYDIGQDRTGALKLAIQNLLLLKGQVHVHITPEKTPRDAAEFLAQRARMPATLRLAGGMGTEPPASPDVGGAGHG